MPVLSSFLARYRLAGPWTAALFLSFLAGAFMPVGELLTRGTVRFSFPAEGLPALAARFCLPTAVSWLLGFFACGVLLLPVWTAFCGYVLAAPAALAVQNAGVNGFLALFARYGLPGFAALPLFFAVAGLSALCSECAFRRLTGQAPGIRQTPMSPPFPLFFAFALLILLTLSVGTAML